jgi:hypothetical protein
MDVFAAGEEDGDDVRADVAGICGVGETVICSVAFHVAGAA